jgi:hypothetical protein
MTTTFQFIEFNPRRAQRGADAARVGVFENGEENWLWMSKSDISKNMMQFGRDAELVKAYEAYDKPAAQAQGANS